MTPVHFIPTYLTNPTNPITVNLIGAGGTGSQVLTALGRINHALRSLGHPGLHVHLFDPDEVTSANLGRQLFADAEIGYNKAVALISRVNRFFGSNWKAIPNRYDQKLTIKTQAANLIITCVDTVSARLDVAEILRKVMEKNDTHRDRPFYWLDFGNSQNAGQVILATVGAIHQPESKLYAPIDQLPFITDEYGDVLQQSETDDDTPSCSLAEALTKQDLFINSTLAQMGSNLLWSMFREGMIDKRGFFLNLKEFRSQPIKL